MTSPAPLDELPIHQAPLTMARAASSDKNFYDRYYFNAHDRTGEVFFVTGLGTYANLGVIDAFATLRYGERAWALRLSDAFDAGQIRTDVGPYRIEVIEPLQTLRLVCEHAEFSFDLTWEGAFPSVLEEHHTLMAGPKAILDATRFAQLGTWSGTIAVGGSEFAVTPDVWLGSRDRSWGIRPVGDPDPAGRMADEPTGGHWWTYLPLLFDEFALIVIVQESPDGHRTLNHATRVFADGRVEQLGWPRVEVSYRSGTRLPEAARVHLATPRGEPLVIELDLLGFSSLTVGAGYGGDPEWQHGQWKGRDWSELRGYDYTDEKIVGMLPFSTVEHVVRATCTGAGLTGAVGHGMFEHAVLGRHDPSGFEGWLDLAP